VPPATTATKAAHQPVYLRSFKLPVPKAAISQKISQALSELGVTHARLVMPTRENCTLLESLLDATGALVETKKAVDRVEQEIRVLKTRLGRRASEGASASADVDAEADVDADGDADADGETNTGTGTPTPMNVDETEGDTGRANSVVSTRSGRSRKQNRRSMSVSSIDTSASVSVRSGRKRQKRT